MIYTKEHRIGRKTKGTIRWWYIRYRLPNGKRRAEKAGTSRKQAEKLLAVRLGQIHTGTYVDPRAAAAEARKAQGPTFEQFVERFMAEYACRTRSNHYERRLAVPKDRFGDRPLRDIGRADLDLFAAERARKVGASTLRKDLASLATLFKKAVQWGVLEASPMVGVERPPEPTHRVRFLSAEEWRRLDEQAPPWLKPVLRAAVATGMRLGELAQLRWDHVDLAGGLLHVAESTKTGTRAIPIGDSLRAVLKGQVRHVRHQLVFVDSDGLPYLTAKQRARITRATIAAMRAAKIHDASFHTLRHTCASWMVQRGVPLFEVQRLLGHSTPQMTTRYSHLSPDHLRGGVAALDAALGGRPGATPGATQGEEADRPSGPTAVSSSSTAT